MTCGEEYAVTHGVLMMLWLLASNLDFQVTLLVCAYENFCNV